MNKMVRKTKASKKRSKPDRNLLNVYRMLNVLHEESIWLESRRSTVKAVLSEIREQYPEWGMTVR